MGSKGSNTTTTNTNQQQSYAPNPQAAGYINSALQQGQTAAQTPFQAPAAPVAGFSQDQQNAFNTVNNAQGMALPYFNTAQNYFSPQGASAFFNPYASNVMSNLQDVFGQQTAQNNAGLTQAAGGVGADRIAVGQAALAKQQGLVAGQTFSDMYRNAGQMAQQAGYGMGALGSQAQNSVLSGAQAQLGTGGLQQQLSQAQMNAPYQNTLARLAYPFQTAQFNAGITGALAPGLGGTTSGYGTNTNTPPQPSMFSQLLGAGTAGVGLYNGFGGSGMGKGSNPSYGMGNGVYGGDSNNPLPGLSASDYGAGYDAGGAVDASGGNPFNLPPGFNDHPIDIAPSSIVPNEQLHPIAPHIPQLNLNPPPQQSGGGGGDDALKMGMDVAKMALMFAKRGGRVDDNPFAFAEGGAPDEDVINPDEPYRMPNQGAVDEWRDGTPAQPMAFAGTDDEEPSPARAAVTGAGRAAPPPSGASAANPYAAPSAQRDSGFAGSPWAALTAAGLGMMAGTSPFAGVNIGQGGMQGMKVLEAQRAAGQRDETISQSARRLELEAKHHEDQFTRLTMGQKQAKELADRPYNEMTAAQKAANEREKFLPSGNLITKDGEVVPLSFNSNTGQYIDSRTDKPLVREPGDKIMPKNSKPVDDADAKALAQYYVKTGDRSRINGLGITSEARQKVQHFIAEAQKDLGVTDEDLGTKVAEFEGRKAGQRTLGVQEAKMGSAAFEAEGAIKQARGIIEKLPRTSWLPLNKLIEGYQKQSLNPDQVELYGRTQAIVNTYSAVMSRGANITTDSARGHANELLNTAGNPETFNRMLDTMLNEIELAKHSPARMREFYKQQYGAKSLSAENSTPAGGEKPDVQTRFKQLTTSGMSEDQAYLKLKEEGYK